MDGTIHSLDGRGVIIEYKDGTKSPKVATWLVHTDVGVLLIRIGDFRTEFFTLDPLAKSLLQYFRLLLPEEAVRMCEIRSLAELRYLWQQEHRVRQHIVLVGHGRQQGDLLFGADGWTHVSAIGGVLDSHGVSGKNVVCLCCEAGYAAFGKTLSQMSFCGSVIAPLRGLHSAIGSQFCQSLFAYHLLEGESVRVAFKHARRAVPGSTLFRLWQSGSLVTDLSAPPRRASSGRKKAAR
ncbi:MAG: hypothetical protein JXA57_10375 [Armatimonadetes bacterium]|nr:hypothetical protein [Armatimonadota bacterium]